ncbi:MAG: hypothetical protein AABW91_03875 [Nanoarchaeota archaeon]
MENKLKVVSVIISVSIIILLFVAGPANAFVLGLTINDPVVNKGEIVEFSVSTQIEPEEVLDIDKFVLILNGPEVQECEFDVNGNIISGCKGISIEKLASSNSSICPGYGYGYCQGVLEYKIRLDSGEYLGGVYHTNLKMIIGESEFEQQGQDVIIGITSLQGCSLRAEYGTFSTEEINTKNNKLNLNVPLRNAVNGGKGYIISQYKKGRAVYQFNIASVIENDEDHAIIIAKGDFKLDGANKIQETSTIYLDKVNMVVNVDGSTFDLNEMPVYFMRRC